MYTIYRAYIVECPEDVCLEHVFGEDAVVQLNFQIAYRIHKGCRGGFWSPGEPDSVEDLRISFISAQHPDQFGPMGLTVAQHSAVDYWIAKEMRQKLGLRSWALEQAEENEQAIQKFGR